MATKKAAPKKIASKKAAAKKKAKKASPKKTARATKAAPPTEEPGIPCICVKVKGRWFCMKKEDGALIQCDGPFATKAECDEHQCF